MRKLNIIICENFAPEYREAVKTEGFDDVGVTAYPCVCINMRNKSALNKIFSEETNLSNDDRLILCGEQCKILSLGEEKLSAYKIRASSYCFCHFANDKLIEYIIKKGGYILSSGWLLNWRENIENAGFDRETAKKFYQGFCTELVFLDSGIDPDSHLRIQELSDYVGIPAVTVSTGLDNIKVLLRSIIYEWRLRKKSDEASEEISKIRMQSAEYSLILDVIEKIAVFTKKRDVIDKIKETFTMIFGANRCKYIEYIPGNTVLSEKLSRFLADNEEYVKSEEKSEIIIKVKHHDELFGILEIGDFLFPQHMPKYLNFIIGITRICALVLSNVKQYELLERSRDEIAYLSYHDALTGLYNRTYFNKVINEIDKTSEFAVFICDIDKLKYVNDTFGHLEGDRLISMAASVFKSSFRSSDVIARIGGDEFAMIVQDCSVETAQILKEKVYKTVETENLQNSDNVFKLSISVGYAVWTDGYASIEKLINEADNFMYADKMQKKQRTENSVFIESLKS